MSDTNNTPNFTLYNQFLKSINDDIDKEITNLFRDKINGHDMNFGKLKDLLQQADTVALNVGDIITGLRKDDITYGVVKAEIDKSMQEIKAKISNFKSNVVTDKKDKSQLDNMVKKNIDEGKTNKVVEELAELHKENGKYKRDDVDTRIKNAKKEEQKLQRMIDQRDDYDKTIKDYRKANPSSSKPDAEKVLNDEFKNLKTANESWKKETQRLQRIGSYDYERKLEDLIDLANNQSEVTPEIAKEFKMFRKRVKDFSNDAVSKYFDTIDKEPTNEDIDTIRNILDSFSSLNLQSEPEMKEPEKVLEKIQQDYKNLVNGSTVSGVTLKYIFEAFPEMKEEILSGIEDGNTGEIDAILKQTGIMLQDFPKKDINQLKYEKERAARKIDAYKNEKKDIESIDPNAPTEEPEAPEDAVTDELDLTDLVGEDFKIELDGELDDEGNPTKFDFSTIDKEDEEAKEARVEEAYKKLRENPTEHRKAIEKLLPTVPRKLPKGLRWLKDTWCKYVWNKHLEKKGKPTSEEKLTEQAIKNALKEKIEGRIAKGEENAQYTEDMLAYNDRFALSNEAKAKFNKAAAEVIVEHIKNGKKVTAKNVNKEAEDSMLDRDDD